jgi:hypothetical protein
MKSFACMFFAKISKLTSNLRYKVEYKIQSNYAPGIKLGEPLMVGEAPCHLHHHAPLM